MNTKETLNANVTEINSLFFNQVKVMTSRNLRSFDSQFVAWGDKMKKYASKKEIYSDEVSKLLVDSNLISTEESKSFRNYILSAAI